MSQQSLFGLLIGFAIVQLLLGGVMLVGVRNVPIGAANIVIGCSLVAIAAAQRKKKTHG